MAAWNRLLLMLLLTALASPAVGQSDTPADAVPADKDAGKELVQQGAESYAEGKHHDAIATWNKALELLGSERGWKLHYNLGLAYGELGDATRAAEQHGAFLERVSKETATLSESLEQRREDAAARLAAIKRDHGAVVLPPQTNEVSVRIDTGEPRRVGFTAYLSPGDHKLVLWAKEGARQDMRVAVSAGQSVLIDTALKAPPQREPTPQPAPAKSEPDVAEGDDPSFPLVVVLVGVGLTGVSFVLPGMMWNRAAGLFDEAEALGKGHTAYPEKVDEYNSARDAYRASYALPAGLGAITLGVAIYGIIHISGDSSDKASLRVGPGSLAIEGSF